MPGMGTTPPQIIIWEDTNLPKQYGLFLLPTVTLQSLKSTALLLKILCSSDTGLGGIALE